MSSFSLAGALERVPSSPTMKLHELIDWRAIDAKLVGLYTRETMSGGGPTLYAQPSMFKLVPLGQWRHLSDAALEQALKVRLDLVVSCEFDLGAALLTEINEQLARPGTEGEQGARRGHQCEHHRNGRQVQSHGGRRPRGQGEAQ